MSCYLLFRALCRPALKLRFSIHCDGVERLPKTGGVILCSNHRRLTDPPILACVLPRVVHFMAKSELFTDHGKLAAFFLRQFGAFPVKRNSADCNSVKTASSLLMDGEVVGIFPEGGLVKDGQPFRPKAGVVHLAQTSGMPLLPVWISYGKRRGVRRSVQLRFGEIIPPEMLSSAGEGRAGLRRLLAHLTVQMNQLGGS